MSERRLIRNVIFGSILLWVSPGAIACGYHDDVTLARGLLNWVYPDALHVIGAMSEAVSERRLPAPNFERQRDPWSYHRIVRTLEQYAKQLRVTPGETPPLEFSLLLIEPMLWTRFTTADGELQARVHVSGPQVGDLVVISGEDVIREITISRLSIGEAYRHGLMRLYGRQEQVALFLTLQASGRGLTSAPTSTAKRGHPGRGPLRDGR